MRHYFRALHAITRRWLAKLSGNELNVLLFIVGRTLRFGKESERIPMRHFLQGVDSQDQAIACGTGLSKNTVLKCIRALQEAGLITVKLIEAGYADIRHVTLNTALLVGTDMPLNLSKREKHTRSAHDHPGANFAPPRAGIALLNRGKKEEEKKEEEKTMAAGRGGVVVPSVRDAIGTVQARYETRRQERAAAPAPRLTAAGVCLCWRDQVVAWQQAQGQARLVTTPTVGDAKVLLANAKKLAFPQGQDLRSFMGWAVEHWDALIHHHFAWMSRQAPPSVPHLGFFARFLQYFVSYYDAETQREAARNRQVTAGLDRQRRAQALEDRLVAEREALDLALQQQRKENALLQQELSASRQQLIRARQRPAPIRPSEAEIVQALAAELPEFDTLLAGGY